MKRILIASIIVSSLVAQTANALLVEVLTYIPAEWIERDGSRTFYGTSNGPCGSAIFGVSKSLANFNELRDDLVLAMTKSYKVSLVVEACEGTKNTVTFAKVCRDSAYF
mgnify:CR=1 FL=1